MATKVRTAAGWTDDPLYAEFASEASNAITDPFVPLEMLTLETQRFIFVKHPEANGCGASGVRKPATSELPLMAGR